MTSSRSWSRSVSASSHTDGRGALVRRVQRRPHASLSPPARAASAWPSPRPLSRTAPRVHIADVNAEAVQQISRQHPAITGSVGDIHRRRGMPNVGLSLEDAAASPRISTIEQRDER